MMNNAILCLNSGSSSIKFAVYPDFNPLEAVVHGTFDRIGLSNSSFTVNQPGHPTDRQPAHLPDPIACVPLLLASLASRLPGSSFAAIGHRIVHGGTKYSQPERITPALIAALMEISSFDPDHMPAALALIAACDIHFAGVKQVACFDTGFHEHLPIVARLLAIPRKYYDQGIRRYGFHGLSYAFLMEELARLAGADVATGHVVLAHLGNGASMAAVWQGTCMDTTKACTPTAGCPMSTRSGDLDPGLVSFFMGTQNMTVDQFHEMVNKRSGLLGISDTSSDVRDLLAIESTDVRAADALGVFCHQAKKSIASMAAAIGGLETLVFSGGIGENSPDMRARICAGLEFIGVDLDPKLNANNAAVISIPGAPVTVRVIATNEELQIARSVARLST